MTNQHATKPIIFSGAMVSALVAERKTQTRRIIKPQPMADGYYEGDLRMERVHHPDSADPDCYARFSADAVGGGAFIEKTIKMPYARGDRLWVRETWRPQMDPDIWCCVEYRTDGARIKPNIADDNDGYIFGEACNAVDPDWRQHGFEPEVANWRPSIHMPRWASRLTLIVTDVRVQRLQDISEAEAVAEGCLMDPEPTEHGDYMPAEIAHEMGGDVGWDSARDWFADLWDSLHGTDAWEANPWIVALTFDMHRGNIDEIASKL